MGPEQDIAARLARYRVTFDQRELWPGLSPSAVRAAQQEIARVAGGVLADAQSPILMAVPPGADLRAMGVAASVSGMGPLLGLWLESGLLRADKQLTALLAAHLDHGRRRAVKLRRELDRLLVAFGDRGLEMVVLKGMHTRYRYFPEPGTRPAADIDLMVPAEHANAARAVLRELDFEQENDQREGQHRSHWTRARGEQVVHSVELAHAENPWCIDLHISLDRRLFQGRTVHLGAAESLETDRWDEFARPVRVLRQPSLFAYLALHASSHFHTMQLIWVLELVLVARRDFANRRSAWMEFEELIRRVGAGRFVFPALELAERLAPGTLDAGVHERLRAVVPSRLRDRVARLTPGSAHQLFRYPPDPAVVWASSLREFVAYVAHVAWPWRGERRLSFREVVAVQRRRLGRVFANLRGGRG